jgi:hypothetical protein
MIARLIAAMLTVAQLSGCASAPTTTVTRWNPDFAVADAERDIVSSTIRFAYVGGFVPYPPGVSDGRAAFAVLRRYGHLEVGSQGCVQDEHAPGRHEYARRYNQKMWSYVSKHGRPLNQAVQLRMFSRAG